MTVAVVWLVLQVAAIRGQPGFAAEMIATRPVAGRAPLSVSVDIPAIDSQRAYRVADVQVKTLRGPSPQDRELTIVVYIGASQRQPEGVAYYLPITLAQGSSEVRREIPFIQPGMQFAWAAEVYEDGTNIEAKSRQNVSRNPFQWYYRNTAISGLPLCGAIVRGKVDELELQEDIVFSPRRGGGMLGSVPAIASSDARSELSVADVIDLDSTPADWRSLAPLDIWVIRAETLEHIIRNEPDFYRALKRYVMSGGSLIAIGDPLPRPIVALFLYGQPADREPPENSGAGLSELFEKTVPDDELYVRRYGAGIVMAGVPVTQMQDGTKVVINDAAKRVSTLASVDSENDEDWFVRHLIADVGKPPVWTFAALIGLFAVFVGPGLIWLTGRSGRRTLLILLVPATSLLATGSVLVYNVFYEGFDSHLRVTGVTWLDTGSGEGFCWSRQTMFTGRALPDGVQLPANAIARPVSGTTAWNYSYEPKKTARSRVRLMPDRQSWQRWLKPRQQQQLLVACPIDQFDSPLELEQVQPGKIRVINRTSATLPVVLARDLAGKYYYAEDLPSEQWVALESEDPHAIVAMAGTEVATFVPTAPAALAGSTSLWDIMSSYSSSSYSTSGSPATLPSDAVGNFFKRYLNSLQGLNPGEFVTVIAENPSVPVGLPDAHTTSVHIVIGSGRW